MEVFDGTRLPLLLDVAQPGRPDVVNNADQSRVAAIGTVENDADGIAISKIE